MRIRTIRTKGVRRRRRGSKLTPIRRHVSHEHFQHMMRGMNRLARAYINRLDKQEDRCTAKST